MPSLITVALAGALMLGLVAEGGPSEATRTLSYYIYDLTFRFMPSFGYSATVSWVIVVLVGILTFAQFVIARERPRR